MTEKTYEIKAICENCGNTQTVVIPKGCRWNNYNPQEDEQSSWISQLKNIALNLANEKWKMQSEDEDIPKKPNASTYVKEDETVIVNCNNCECPMLRKRSSYELSVFTATPPCDKDKDVYSDDDTIEITEGTLPKFKELMARKIAEQEQKESQ